MAKKTPQLKKPKKKLMDVVELGRQGGAARAAKMSPEERSEASRKAVQARWAAAKKAAGAKKKEK